MSGILGVRKAYSRRHANGRAFPGDQELPSGLILRHLECEVAKGHGEDVQLQLERI